MSVSDPGTLLGRGIAFPPRVGADGRIAWSEGEANIRDAIRVVLGTERGERLRLPDFGAGLGRFLFEPNTVATHHALERRILRALASWEPRISVQSVDVAPDPGDGQGVVATISYTLIATQASTTVSVAVALAS